MTEPKQLDVAIIGAGTAGMAAYREVAKQTDSVLLIEGNAYGTTCARVGCMPSKMLIAAADAAHAGQHAEGFGVHFAQPDIDGRAVMKRLKSLRDRYVNGVKDSVKSWPEDHRTMARARFAGPQNLALEPLDGSGEYSVSPATTIIATGASAVLPDLFAHAGSDVITSDDVFEWNDLPSSVLVFGAGVIGLEIGQALHRLGVRVVLLGKDRSLAQITDPEVLDTALKLFQEDLEFHADHELDTLEKTDKGVHAVWSSSRGGGDEVFEKVLVSVGRRPNVAGLDLENAGIELDDDGVPVFDPVTGRCGESTVYIAGDASNHIPLLHVAAHQGKVAGPNAAQHPDTRQVRMPAGLSVTFCDPQIATAGRGYAALKEDGVAFECGEIDWSDQGRATVMRVNRGLARLYGETGTGKLLGAEMVGPSAEHLSHLLAWSIDAGHTVMDVLDRPYYHPCLEEGLRTALRNLAYALGERKEAPIPRCLDCGPGG